MQRQRGSKIRNVLESQKNCHLEGLKSHFGTRPLAGMVQGHSAKKLDILAIHVCRIGGDTLS